MVARVATKEEMNPLVVVLFVAVRLVMKAFVVVELPTMRLVMLARVVTRDAMNPLVVVLFVVEELVVTKLVAVALIAVRKEVDALVAARLVVVIPVADAVVRVVCPDTLRVPFEVSEVVAVIEPPVRVPTEATVVLELPTMRLVMVARVEKRDAIVPVVEKRFVLVLLVITEEEAKMLFTKRLRNLLRGVARL